MFVIYLLILIGFGISSLGLPSKTGRKGSAASTLLLLGTVISLGGAIFLFLQGEIIQALIVGVAVFFIPGALAHFRK